MNNAYNPNHFDILSVLEGESAGKEMTYLVSAQLERGWAPHYNVTYFRGFIIQSMAFSGDIAPLPYELLLVQGVSSNDLVTQVREMRETGWNPYLGIVATERHVYQWVMKEESKPASHALNSDQPFWAGLVGREA